MQRFKQVLEILAAIATLIGLVFAYHQYRMPTPPAAQHDPASSSDTPTNAAEPPKPLPSLPTTQEGSTPAPGRIVSPSPAEVSATDLRPEGATLEAAPATRIRTQTPPNASRSFDLTLRAGEQATVLDDRVGLGFSLQELGHSVVPVLSISIPGREVEDHTLLAPTSRFSFSLDQVQWNVFVLSTDVPNKLVLLRLSKQ